MRQPHSQQPSPKLMRTHLQYQAFTTALAVGAVVSFMVLTAWLLRDAGPMAMDRWIADTLADQQDDGLRPVGRLLTLPGNAIGSLVAAVFAGCYFWIKRSTLTPAVLLVVAYAGAYSTAVVLKRVVERVPPRFWLEQDTGYSFPSGHAARATAVLGTIVVIVAIVHGRGAALISTVVALVSVGATVTGHVYLRFHWFTDMIGGLAVGAFWVAILTPIAIGRIRKPDDARAGIEQSE